MCWVALAEHILAQNQLSFFWYQKTGPKNSKKWNRKKLRVVLDCTS